MRLFLASPLSVGEVGGTVEPGLAWSAPGILRLGHEAFRAARMDPQSLRTEPWELPSLHPLPGADKSIRHGADLCLAQLRKLALPKDQAWSALVPATWEHDQIRIFLGVAKELGWTMRWVMPRALALAALAAPEAETLAVMEWAWTHLTVSELVREKGQWRVRQHAKLAEAGLFKLFRREADAANEIHLRQTRADLMNLAADEQKLFDAWWRWHHHGESWKGGSLVLDEVAPFAKLHAIALPSLAKYDQPGTIMPSALRHILGFSRARADDLDLRGILDAVPDVAGGRTRLIDQVVPPARTPPPLPLPVTHWVVGGIAESVEGEAAAVPGQSVMLSDGRKALAIHVPRFGGTP
jgi:hypothetical protein